jgi:AbiV family abortive infection protein
MFHERSFQAHGFTLRTCLGRTLGAAPDASQPDSHPSTGTPHQIVDACIKNAADLLAAAELCHGNDMPAGVVYHLAILALEEIGKSEIVRVIHVAEEHDKDPSSYEKHTTDHVKKLFWAIWGPGWSSEGYAPGHFTEMRGLAAQLHAKRMKALYVSPTPEEFTVYENAVPVDEVKAILGFARARVAMMKQLEPRAPSADETENARWFMAATDDSERRRRIFSPTSMEKLEEPARVKHFETPSMGIY